MTHADNEMRFTLVLLVLKRKLIYLQEEGLEQILTERQDHVLTDYLVHPLN